METNTGRQQQEKLLGEVLNLLVEVEKLHARRRELEERINGAEFSDESMNALRADLAEAIMDETARTASLFAHTRMLRAAKEGGES